MKKTMITITMILTLILGLGILTGCGQQESASTASTELATGGVLVLSVNPEIAIEYDQNGIVTAVIARNNDAIAIIDSCKDLIGQEAKNTVTTLVTAIGNAGYFVEEIEGDPRRITIEIEPGSALPSDTFLDDVIQNVQDCVNKNSWKVPTEAIGNSNYGNTDYGSSGNTDYGISDYGSSGTTDYGNSDYGSSGNTDYGNSDYGSSGSTDYGNSDYDSSNSTDYGDSDYGSSNSTDYGNSDYGNSDYGNSDYGDSDYGNSNYD